MKSLASAFVICMLAVVAVRPSAPALAETGIPGNASFAGKQLDFIVGMPPGGGVDAYARLVQKNLAQLLPGHPTIVVDDMPGAGSLRSVIALEHDATPNTVMVNTFSSSLLTESVVNPKRVPVDFRTFAFLGNIAEDSRVCFVRSALGITSIKQLQGRAPLNFGATAPGTSGNADVSMLVNLFHVKVHAILGYPGSADKILALDRGEIDGDCAGVTSIPSNWIKAHKINILLRFSPICPPGVDPSVPFGGSLITDETDREAYNFLIAPQRLGRLFMVSRKTPPAQIALLRRAFDQMVKEPQFLADASSMNLPVVPTSGAEVDHMVADLTTVGPNVIKRARQVLGE